MLQAGEFGKFFHVVDAKINWLDWRRVHSPPPWPTHTKSRWSKSNNATSNRPILEHRQSRLHYSVHWTTICQNISSLAPIPRQVGSIVFSTTHYLYHAKSFQQLRGWIPLSITKPNPILFAEWRGAQYAGLEAETNRHCRCRAVRQPPKVGNARRQH